MESESRILSMCDLFLTTRHEWVNIAKKQEFELITSHHFKNTLSVESNSLDKFKAIASLPILPSYFRSFFLRFLKKFCKPEHGNLVLLTSTFQVGFQL